jgi:hypothetical protein
MKRTTRWTERPRSILLRTALWLYNACAFVALMVVGCRNAMWNEKKWTPRPVARGS